MSFKHFLRTGKFEQDEQQFETTVIEQGQVPPPSSSSCLINEPVPIDNNNGDDTKTYHKLFRKHSAVVTIELTATDLQRPQEAVANQYGINKIIFSKMWKNSVGRGVRWPNRRLAVIRSQINNLCKTQRSEQANQEQISKLRADYLTVLASYNRKLQLHQSYFENRRTRTSPPPPPPPLPPLEDGLFTLLQHQEQFQLWSPDKQPPQQPPSSVEISNNSPIVDTFENDHSM